MIDSILKLGEIYNDDDSILTERVTQGSGKERILLRIIFDFDQKRVEFEPKQFEDKLAEEYRWIGNTFSASKESMARLTFTNWSKIREAVENVCNRLRGIAEFKDLVTELENVKNQFLKDADQVVSSLTKEVKQIESSGDAVVVLYTIVTRKGGNAIEWARTELYGRAIKYLLSWSERKTKGVCHLCGREGEVFYDPAFERGTLLKIYVVDQPGYMSGVADRKNKDSLLRTFALCADCRFSLILGEKKISRDLTVNIAGLATFAVPRVGITKGRGNGKEVIDEISELFKEVCSGISKLDRLQPRVNKMAGREWYSLSLIFGERKQSSFSYEGMIQEIPPTQLLRLGNKINDLRKCATSMLGGDSSNWELTLQRIADLIPLRIVSGKVNYKPFIDLLTSLLKSYPYPREELVELAVRAAAIHRFESYGGYRLRKMGNPDISLTVTLLKYNFLMILMKEMGIISQTEGFSQEVDVDKRLKDWISEMKYDGRTTSLFLLGYLIGEIGNEQYNKEDKRKSILEKIDFKGMKWERILRLVGDVLASLRNYRILEYNEKTYYEVCRLINMNRDLIQKSDAVENLFYILTGYAFATYLAISGGGKQ